MTKFVPVIATIWTLWSGAVCAASESNDSGSGDAVAKTKTLNDLREIAPKVRASKNIAENYGLCPVELGSSKNLAARFGAWLAGGDTQTMDCSATVMECWKACEVDIDWACRNLANVAQDFADQIGKDIHRRLYAHGCALGDPNACTNRAAGIVNSIWDKDPVEPLDAAKRAQCTITMYEDACSANEYWGCSQAGIERSQGHLSILDAKKAAAAAKKACEIDAKQEGTDLSVC